METDSSSKFSCEVQPTWGRVIAEERHHRRGALGKRQVTLGHAGAPVGTIQWKGWNPPCRREKYKYNSEICKQTRGMKPMQKQSF